MTPAELRAAGDELARLDPATYGRGWQSALARRLKIDGRTVRSWLQGRDPIPGPAETAVRLLLEKAS